MRWAARTFVVAAVILALGTVVWRALVPSFAPVRAMTVPLLAAGGLTGFGVGRDEQVGRTTAEQVGTVGSALCYVSVLLPLFRTAQEGMVGYVATAVVGVALLGVRFGHPEATLFSDSAPTKFQETDERATNGRVTETIRRVCPNRGDENE